MSSVHFSSETNEWHTPQYLFDDLNAEFGFQTDLAATKENAKCQKFFTVEDDSLKQEWQGVCFLNPPYGRAIRHFIQKAYEASQKGATVVCLVPARTDTSYWHDFVIGGGAEVRFIRGRIKFIRQDGFSAPAPFPSAIVIFRGHNV